MEVFVAVKQFLSRLAPVLLMFMVLMPNAALAAITLVTGGALNGQVINGGNVTLTFPAGVQQGDVVILYGGHPHRASTPIGPSTAGYTQIVLNNSVAPDFGAWYKVMGATPDTSVVGQGSASNQDATAYGAFILRGVDTSTIFDQTATTAGPITSTNPDAPAITTLTDGAWVIPMAGSQVLATSVTPPTGYSNNNGNSGNDTNDISVYGATLEKTPAGLEDPSSWTGWASGAWFTITVALLPQASAQINTTPSRSMRIFEGFRIILYSGRIIIYGNQQ